jgi:p24 family protein beta-1
MLYDDSHTNSSSSQIYDPRGNTLYQGLHFDSKMKGRQRFTAADSGSYKFCFNNEMSRFTAKVVTFKVTVGQEQSKPEVAKPGELSAVDEWR